MKLSKRQKHWIALAIRIVLTVPTLPFDIITLLGELSDRYVRSYVFSLSAHLSNWEHERTRCVVSVGPYDWEEE